MPRTRLFAAAALALSHAAFAQVPVGAGGQIQQIPPPPSREQRSIPEIRIEPGSAPSSPAADSRFEFLHGKKGFTANHQIFRGTQVKGRRSASGF